MVKGIDCVRMLVVPQKGWSFAMAGEPSDQRESRILKRN